MTEQSISKKAVIVKIGAHQHLVFAGNKVTTSRVEQAEGELLAAKDMLTNKDVTFKVVSHILGEKIRGLKFKNKVRYLRRYGHRQQLSVLELASDSKPTEGAAKKPAVAKKAPVKNVKE